MSVTDKVHSRRRQRCPSAASVVFTVALPPAGIKVSAFEASARGRRQPEPARQGSLQAPSVGRSSPLPVREAIRLSHQAVRYFEPAGFSHTSPRQEQSSQKKASGAPSVRSSSALLSLAAPEGRQNGIVRVAYEDEGSPVIGVARRPILAEVGHGLPQGLVLGSALAQGAMEGNHECGSASVRHFPLTGHNGAGASILKRPSQPNKTLSLHFLPAAGFTTGQDHQFSFKP